MITPPVVEKRRPFTRQHPPQMVGSVSVTASLHCTTSQLALTRKHRHEPGNKHVRLELRYLRRQCGICPRSDAGKLAARLESNSIINFIVAPRGHLSQDATAPNGLTIEYRWHAVCFIAKVLIVDACISTQFPIKTPFYLASEKPATTGFRSHRRTRKCPNERGISACMLFDHVSHLAMPILHRNVQYTAAFAVSEVCRSSLLD